MTTYNEIVAYWQSMPTLIPGIRSVTVGADEDVLAMQNTRIAYPHLWVETPQVRFVGADDNPRIRLDFALNLIQGENLKTNPAANATLSGTLNLLTALYAQVLADADNDLFGLILSPNQVDPIRRWSADNAYGWRLELSIEIERVECGPPIEVWQPTPITGDTYMAILPAGYLLVAIYLLSDAAQTPQVGSTPGGDDIGPARSADAGQAVIFAGLSVYAEVDTMLYFSGLAGTNTLKIWMIKG